MSERRLTEHGVFSVLVIDMAHYGQANDITIAGFPDLALARDYARRRTRSSLEELRASNASHAVLKMAWSVFGEDCIVLGQDDYRGASEIDYFIAYPASTEEQDWLAIETLILSQHPQ